MFDVYIVRRQSTTLNGNFLRRRSTRLEFHVSTRFKVGFMYQELYYFVACINYAPLDEWENETSLHSSRLHMRYHVYVHIDSLLFLHSNAPYVRKTREWPSPWSSDSRSDVRSIAFWLRVLYILFFFEKNNNTEDFACVYACVFVLLSVRCTIVSNGELCRLNRGCEKLHCIRCELCRREKATAKTFFLDSVFFSLFLMRFQKKRRYWKWNLFEFRIFLCGASMSLMSFFRY